MPGSEQFHRLALLSQLGLPEKIFVSAFISELHKYIPSYSNSYAWLDRKFELNEFFDDKDQGQSTRSIREFIKSQPPQDLRELFAYSFIMTNQPQWRSHSLSRFYKRCFLRNGYHQSCILPFALNKHPHGFLILNWNETGNIQLEAELLEKLRIYFVSGLGNKKTECEKTTRGWRTGQIIVNQYGQVTHCCPEGKNLLDLALQKKPGNLLKEPVRDVRNIPGIMQLIMDLQDSPPRGVNSELTTSSQWGDFVIQGFPIKDENGQRELQIHLNITWRVPFSLLLFHNINSISLTPRQEIIGLLYAKGESNKSIANKLELSLYTVKDHIQHIFENMQIHTRAELIENILCQDSSDGIRESQQCHLNGAERATMNLGRT